MKQLMVLLICIFLVIGGCQEASRDKGGVNVTIEGGGEFPEFLAGTWKSDNKSWQIVFEADGRISSAVIPLCLAKVMPNRTTKVLGPNGEPGFVEAGDFRVSYNPQSSELSVNIKIKRFCLYLFDGGALKGSWEYIVVGNILGDGKTWPGDVFSSMDIVAIVPDPNSPKDKPEFKEGTRLRINFGEEGEEVERLILTKVPDVNANPH